MPAAAAVVVVANVPSTDQTVRATRKNETAATACVYIALTTMAVLVVSLFAKTVGSTTTPTWHASMLLQI